MVGNGVPGAFCLGGPFGDSLEVWCLRDPDPPGDRGDRVVCTIKIKWVRMGVLAGVDVGAEETLAAGGQQV